VCSWDLVQGFELAAGRDAHNGCDGPNSMVVGLEPHAKDDKFFESYMVSQNLETFRSWSATRSKELVLNQQEETQDGECADNDDNVGLADNRSADYFENSKDANSAGGNSTATTLQKASPYQAVGHGITVDMPYETLEKATAQQIDNGDADGWETVGKKKRPPPTTTTKATNPSSLSMKGQYTERTSRQSARDDLESIYKHYNN